MKIKSIKLNEGGLKGCLVKFESVRPDINDLTWRDTDTKDTEAPVSQKVKELFDELTEHFKQLMGFEEDAEVNVTQVVSNLEDWLLTGHVVAQNGKKVGVSGPNVVESQDYGPTMEVLDIIRKIYEEMVKHLQGKQKMEAKQVIMDFKAMDGKKLENLLKKAGVTDEELQTLDLDDKDGAENALKMMKKLLEARGSIIIDSDDFQEEEADSDAVKIDAEVTDDEDLFEPVPVVEEK